MNKLKKISIVIIFVFINLLISSKAFAATLTLVPSKESVGIGEQFYVDLKLDTEGASINAISGNITLPLNNLSYIRTEDGKSMVNLWVEKAKINGNILSFAGVMSNGFSGVIDPFNLDSKLSGLILRIVLEGKSTGQANLSTSTFSMNLNDGDGTEINSPSINKVINIADSINKIKYESKEIGNPELEAYVTQDQNIFDNKYVLVFKATDKTTGIKSIRIKEGRRDWKDVESPYLLKDQSRHSDISLQAMNYSGGGVVVNIAGIPYDWKYFAKVVGVIVAVLLLVLFLIFKKRNVIKK